ncbi:MAG: UDP-N-acetylglucosamine 2-epimerase (non-hydrolyzing) [Bacillota bacterium]|nr:UDP-N-acetylglucosamine 2-epimerase (non-hydrolyzing) [Bacillota bacterium]
MKKVLLVFGTRPEAIKMAPLVKALEQSEELTVGVAVTAQHREMLDQVLELFGIVPDYDLNIMKAGQTLFDITAQVLVGLKDVLEDFKPDLLLVHGDTTTTMAASLAGFYEGVAVGHVEAGLRTGDKLSPWPEEINRRITDVLADYYFAPTELNRDNLLKENVPTEKIFVTGNTVIDALLWAVNQERSLVGFGLDDVDWSKKIILLTCHRRENWGAPMDAIFSAVRDIKENHDDVEVIFPVHKNPLVRKAAAKHFQDVPGIHCIEPLDYHPFSLLINKAYLVMTDSGGIQEEAPSLGKPVLVLRDTTERPEAVKAGTVKVAGTDENTIIALTEELLTNRNAYEAMAKTKNPYGDGHASEMICRIIVESAKIN